MTTRTCVARLVDREGLRFEGVVVLEEGLPTEMGRLLRGMGRTTEALPTSLEWVIDEHPAGWRSLRRGICLCSTADELKPVDEITAMAMGVTLAYVFDVGARTLLVLSVPAPDAAWQVAAEVSIDGPEPDWQVIEQAAGL